MLVSFLFLLSTPENEEVFTDIGSDISKKKMESAVVEVQKEIPFIHRGLIKNQAVGEQ